jgi:hypothetical protein
MKLSKSPGPIFSPDDHEAALYTGHLAVQAEISLPGAQDETRMALTWLASHIAETQARLWKARLDDITAQGKNIGSWTLVARTTSEPTRSITIERHGTLIRDGHEVSTACRAIADDADPEVTESVIDFAIMVLASHTDPRHLKIEIMDMFGCRISISLTKNLSIKEKVSKLFVRFQ